MFDVYEHKNCFILNFINVQFFFNHYYGFGAIKCKILNHVKISTFTEN